MGRVSCFKKLPPVVTAERQDGIRPADFTDFAELAAALKTSWQAVQKRSVKESWPYEERPVRGGRKRFFPLSTLSTSVRKAITTYRLEQAISHGDHSCALVDQNAGRSAFPAAHVDKTDSQRLIEGARQGVLHAIRRFQAEASCSQETAMQTLLALAASGRAEPHLVRALQMARDGRGRKGKKNLPSVRSLKRWLGQKDLTPKRRKKDMRVPPWAAVFFKHYQQPQKPSVEAAYRAACNEWTAAERPSIHQVRGLLRKLGTVTRERGRMGPRELKKLQPFVRRDFSHLEPNDVWTADGHTFDAEVQHPLHGRPFRPEITTILDIATRRCVGWSIDLAESSTAVIDAIRHAAERNGSPAILYVDNGSGYDNDLMKAEGIGLMGRIGTEIRHSLPYNSQARGVIERAHQTLWVQAAKALPSYVGHAMDREARLAQFKLTRQALKKGGAMPLIPWEVFVQFVEERVAEYNARPHRTLKGTSPDLAWRAWEARGWKADTLTTEEAATLFRPRVTRIIQRAEIALFTNIYFALDLTEFHGMEAQIAYDIHDASRIWVYTPEGRFICEAQVNGNRRHYMPVPVVHQAREKRAKGRLARVNAKRSEILEELHGDAPITAPAGNQMVLVNGQRLSAASLIAAETSQPEPVARPLSRSERPIGELVDEWLALDARIKRGEAVDEDDAFWHQSVQDYSPWKAEMKWREGGKSA